MVSASIGFLFMACVKDIPHPDTQLIPDTQHKGVFMLHEGAYGNNNSEFSYLDFSNGQLSESIYHTVNGSSLGDVAQSVYRFQQHLFIALTNSNEVIELDALNFKEIHRYSSISSPRYILAVNDSLIYVSSLYQNKVFVLNHRSQQIVSSIALDHANSEQMVLKNSTVWLTSWHVQCNYVYKINAQTHTILDRITLPGFAPHGIVEDKNGLIWVLSGNQYKSVTSHLTCIQSSNGDIISDFTFPTSAEPIKLSMNPTKDTLYFIGVNYAGNSVYNGLYRMSINDTTLPTQPFITANNNSYYWGYGIDPITHDIYLSDPKGFTQHSTIYVYSSTGISLRQFEGGIGTNSFLFY